MLPLAPLLAAALLAPPAAHPDSLALPYAETKLPHGKLEVVHRFTGPMPTGVTVSRTGRVFVSYPRWGDAVAFTVGEIRGGREVAFPDATMNDPRSPDHLFSVQSVVVDSDDRLWALDTGSLEMKPIEGQDWPKLVAFDLATGKMVRTVRFPPEVVRRESYLNDVRFDLRRGKAGVAYITDSTSTGPSGIIVVDLASGRSWRRLDGAASTSADPQFIGSIASDRAFFSLQPTPEAGPVPPRVGADGLALSADGARLFFCPLASRTLYSVSAELLADEASTTDQLAATLTRETREFASDGLQADAQGRVYLTDWEHDAVVVRTGEGRFETLVTDPQLSWPDSLSLTDDGWLYVTANQLHRQAKFRGGKDARKKPYLLLRVKIPGATAIRLGRSRLKTPG